MTEQLYRATVGKNKDVLVTPVKDVNRTMYLIVGTTNYTYEDLVTDLRPVQVVDADAVVIEGVTEPRLLRLLNLAVLHVPLDKFEDDWKLIGSLARNLNDKLIAERDAQLSTPVEPATGGEKEPVCKDCGGIKHDENGRWCESDFHSPSKPTPTVTIELPNPEDELIWLGQIMKFLYENKHPGWGDYVKGLTEAITEQLTPPRPEEPKEYTQLVRANEKGFIARPRWQKNIANDLWNSDDGDINVKWSDLENPVVLEGQVW